jgi:protein gp37
MSETRIEWTDATWNPVTGCTKTAQVPFFFKQRGCDGGTGRFGVCKKAAGRELFGRTFDELPEMG